MKLKILSKNHLNYSNRRFRQEAKELNIQLTITDPQECEVFLAPNAPTMFIDGQEMARADLILPRIGASINNYALSVVTQFEMMDIPVVNGSLALYQSKNKISSVQLMSKKNIDMPKTVFVRRPSDLSKAVDRLGGFPVMLKLLSGTQGIGVMIAHNMNSIESTLDTLWSLGQDILIQECIEESLGKDMRVFVVGDQVVGAMQRTARIGEFRSNIHRGALGQAVDLTDEYKDLSLRACRAIGLEVAGVDLLESDQGPKVIEVNASPGFEGLEVASGLNIAKTVLEYCKQRHG